MLVFHCLARFRGCITWKNILEKTTWHFSMFVEITFIVFSLYLRVFFCKRKQATNNQPNCRGVAGYGTTVAKHWPNVVLDICGFCGMEAAELVEAMDEELEAVGKSDNEVFLFPLIFRMYIREYFWFTSIPKRNFISLNFTSYASFREGYSVRHAIFVIHSFQSEIFSFVQILFKARKGYSFSWVESLGEMFRWMFLFVREIDEGFHKEAYHRVKKLWNAWWPSEFTIIPKLLKMLHLSSLNSTSP